MRVYLAAQYPRRSEMLELAEVLWKHGVLVRSRWLHELVPPDRPLGELSPTFCVETARADLEDIDACHTLVFFSEDPLVGIPRGGRHVEFGYALAKGKRIVVIGGQENIFHFLPHIVHYPDVDSFLESEGIQNASVAE